MRFAFDNRFRQQAIAVAFAFLLVVSMIASPALATGLSSESHAQPATTELTDGTSGGWALSESVVAASNNRTNATESYDSLSEGSVDTQFGTHPLEQNITIPDIEANSTVAILRNAHATIADINTSDEYTEAVNCLGVKPRGFLFR